MAKRYNPIYNWTRQAGRFILDPAARAAVMRELDGHIEDRIEAYMDAGLSREEAQQKAAAAMGDPAETGQALAKIHKPWLNLLHISNPYNLIFSLLAYLPIFLFPIKYGIGRTLTNIGFVLLLACQLFFNRGHQASGAEDPHGKAMEKMTLRALERFTPITTHGAYGGVGVTGPTQNIQATDSQRAQLTSWVLIFGLWFICLVGLGDALHGVAAESSFAASTPLFVGLLLTAAADLLLASPKGKAAKSRLLALAACGLLLVWYMPAVL